MIHQPWNVVGEIQKVLHRASQQPGKAEELRTRAVMNDCEREDIHKPPDRERQCRAVTCVYDTCRARKIGTCSRCQVFGKCAVYPALKKCEDSPPV